MDEVYIPMLALAHTKGSGHMGGKKAKVLCKLMGTTTKDSGTPSKLAQASTFGRTETPLKVLL